MLMSNWKLATVRTFAVVLLVTGAWALSFSQEFAQVPAKDKPRVDQQGELLPSSALARFGSARFRHNGAFFVSYLPDGKSLLSVSTDGTVRVWDALSGMQLRQFGKRTEAPAKQQGFNPWMRLGFVSAALSRDGKTLALSGLSGTVQLWEVATGKAGALLEVGDMYTTLVDFSLDGKHLIVKGQDGTRMYELATTKEVRQFANNKPGQKQVYYGGPGGVVLSLDGRQLVVVGRELQDRKVRTFLKVWEVSTGKELRQLNGPGKDFSGQPILAPDGKSIVWGNLDGSIHFWDLEKDREIKKFAHGKQKQYPSALRFSPDGKTLAVKYSRSVHLWDVAGGKQVHQLGEAEPVGRFVYPVEFGPVGVLTPLAFSKDGKALAVLDGNTIRPWDVGGGKEKGSAPGHQGAVLTAFASADEKTLTTLGADETVRRWEVSTGKELSTLTLPTGTALALAADGKIAATMDPGTATIRIWDVTAGKELRSMKKPPVGEVQMYALSELALSPSGKYLAVRSWGTSLELWDTTNGKQLPVASKSLDPETFAFVAYDMPRRKPTDLVFAPDGRTLAFMVPAGGTVKSGTWGTHARSIRLWDAALGKDIIQLEGAYRGMVGLAFSPDGKTLAVRETDKLTVMELATGKSRFQIKGLPTVQLAYGPMGMGTAPAVAFSPDGKMLAASGDPQTPRLWDMATGKEVGQLKGHQSDLETLAFTASGNRLVTGSSDTTALLWDVAAMRKVKLEPTPPLTDKVLAGLWADLNSNDSAKAFEAIRLLEAAPKQAIALLRGKLKPAEVDDKRLARLIADLNSNTYKSRQDAFGELQKLGDLAEPALSKFLKDDPPLEARQRVEKLLAKLGSAPPSGEMLRSWRALEVLEWIGTKEAREVLGPLTKGAAGSQLTREARRILDRLDQRTLPQR
jgi:WD40 repeat protein